MSRIVGLAGSALVMLVVPSRVSAQVPTGAALRSEVQQAVRAYVDAWNQADASNLVEMYSREPGVTSVGDGEIIRGWDRIRERYDSLVGIAGRFKLAIGSIDVVAMGMTNALALTSYTLTIHANGGDVQHKGAMTLVFQKAGGQWKVIHDHTSTLPTTGEALATAAPAAAPVAPVAAPVAAPPAAPPSFTIPITNGQAVEIEPGKLVHYTFQVPAATCVISGRIVGISGGGKDFEALIMDEDNFQNWSAGHEARVYWQSGRAVVANIQNAVVTGPGTFHLVLSNVFSAMTAKTVQAAALAQCSR